MKGNEVSCRKMLQIGRAPRMIEWCYLLGTGTRRVLNVEKEFSGDMSGKTFVLKELSADT